MDHMRRVLLLLAMLGATFSLSVSGQDSNAIPSGSKVFIAPMNGFETYLKAAITEKKVPVEIVDQKEQADFEISGASQSQKASTAKKVIMLDWRSREEAGIKVANLKTGVVVFAYSVVKSSSAHGKQSSAEACAKHLKETIMAK